MGFLVVIQYSPKSLIILLTGCAVVSPAFADLGSDISAVAAAESSGQQAEARAAAKARAAAQAAAKARAAAQAEIRRKQEAIEQREYDNQMADKKRDQSYEDELRQLEIEERKLELARKKARVNRENDFIEQELKRESAKTDVIQSGADSARNLSSGSKTLMEKEGEAKVKKESGFFKQTSLIQSFFKGLSAKVERPFLYNIITYRIYRFIIFDFLTGNYKQRIFRDPYHNIL